MTVRQLVYYAAPVNIIGASTGRTLKRNVTTEMLDRNPKLGTLNVLGVQTATLLVPCDQFTCWVDEKEFNATK